MAKIQRKKIGSHNLFQVGVFNYKDHSKTLPSKDSNMSPFRQSNKTSWERKEKKLKYFASEVHLSFLIIIQNGMITYSLFISRI